MFVYHSLYMLYTLIFVEVGHCIPTSNAQAADGVNSQMEFVIFAVQRMLQIIDFKAEFFAIEEGGR